MRRIVKIAQRHIASLVAVLITVLAVLMSPYITNDREFHTLLIGLFGSLVVWVCETAVRKLAESRFNIDGCPDDLRPIVSRFVRAGTAEVNELCRAQPIRPGGEDAVFQDLYEELERLMPGDSLFAICTDKTWTSDAVRAYFERNGAKQAEGVNIERIFQKDSPEARAEAQRQRDRGIRAGVVPANALANVDGYTLGAEVGVAVFNGRIVVIHFGTGNNTKGYRFDAPIFAQFMRTQFDALAKVARLGRSEPPPEAADAARRRARREPVGAR